MRAGLIAIASWLISGNHHPTSSSPSPSPPLSHHHHHRHHHHHENQPLCSHHHQPASHQDNINNCTIPVFFFNLPHWMIWSTMCEFGLAEHCSLHRQPRIWGHPRELPIERKRRGVIRRLLWRPLPPKKLWSLAPPINQPPTWQPHTPPAQSQPSSEKTRENTTMYYYSDYCNYATAPDEKCCIIPE